MSCTEEYNAIQLTNKGIALVAAFEAGLCPQIADGVYDTTAFTHFWEAYQKTLRQDRANIINDLREMLHEEGYQTAHDCACQRKRYLKLTLCSLGGLIFGGLVTKLLLFL